MTEVQAIPLTLFFYNRRDYLLQNTLSCAIKERALSMFQHFPQVIALLCYLMETKREAGPFLIVVPSSVFSNWVSEIKRWAPSATTVPYRGNPDTRRRIYR